MPPALMLYLHIDIEPKSRSIRPGFLKCGSANCMSCRWRHKPLIDTGDTGRSCVILGSTTAVRLSFFSGLQLEHMNMLTAE